MSTRLGSPRTNNVPEIGWNLKEKPAMVKLLVTASEVLRRHDASRFARLGTVAGALLLTACATPSTPPPIAQPAPKAVDPRVCAKAELEPKIAGGIVQPTTDQERDATAAFLNYVSEALSWGRRGWERAAVAANGC